MNKATARQRLTDARVGRLATVTPDDRPHVVPCCFVLVDETLYSAVDSKPKATLDLRRLQNLRTNSACSLLVDHYDEDWTKLWWVRVDGRGYVVDESDERVHALGLLSAKYEQYRESIPPGPVLSFAVVQWRMWP